MRAKLSIHVTRNELPRFSQKFLPGVADAINHGINSAIEAADPLTREDTGDLIGNKDIDYATEGNLEGEIVWAMEYAVYQNYGFTHYRSGEHIAGTHFADEGAEVGGRAMRDKAGSIL